MAKLDHRRETLISAFKVLSPSHQGRFGRLFVQVAVANQDSAALELEGTTWVSVAEQAFNHLNCDVSPDSQLDPVVTDNLSMRGSIRIGMEHCFPNGIALATEPWTGCQKNKLEAGIWMRLYLHRSSIATLLKDAPGMLPVWYWFTFRYPSLAEGEPLQALSQKISISIRPASWRRLLRMPWPVLLRYCPGEPIYKFDQLMTFLELLEAVDLPSVQHSERLVFLHEALARAGCHVFAPESVQQFMPLNWIRELMTTPDETMVSDVGIYTVIRWHTESDRPSPVKDGKCSWKKLYETARGWARQNELILAARNYTWESAINAFRIGDYVVVPLTSEVDLIEEGCEMNHCVANYTDDCANGDYRIFSVRDSSTGKTVATFSIVYDEEEGWRFDMANGFANTPVPPAIRGLANFVAYAYEN